MNLTEWKALSKAYPFIKYFVMDNDDKDSLKKHVVMIKKCRNAGFWIKTICAVFIINMALN